MCVCVCVCMCVCVCIIKKCTWKGMRIEALDIYIYIKETGAWRLYTHTHIHTYTHTYVIYIYMYVYISRPPYFWDVFGIRWSFYFSRAQKLCPRATHATADGVWQSGNEIPGDAVRSEIPGSRWIGMQIGISGFKGGYWTFALPTPAF
jgi:hypothetical protein